MNSSKQKVLQLITSLPKKIFILNNINPSTSENDYITGFLDLFIHLQYIFNIYWIKSSLDIELYWLVPFLGFVSIFLDLISKMVQHLKGVLKIKKCLLCVLRLCITILIKALFLIAFEKLTMSRGNIDMKAQILFNILINYILTLMNTSFEYLSWQFMVMMFFLTFLITSGLSLKNPKMIHDHSNSHLLSEEYQLGLTTSNIIIFLIVALLIRRRISISDSIEAIAKDTPVGKVVLKKNSKEIMFANETVYKILGIKERNLSFADLNSCSFDRFLKLTEETPMVFHYTNFESPCSSKQIHRKTLTLVQILDSLKGSPHQEVLTFYTTIDTRQHGKPYGWRQNSEKLGNELRPAMFQSERNLLDSDIMQYEVKISYINWNYGREKYLYMQFNDITELQKILGTEKQIEFKTKILHSFSHELKTPLNISKNMIDLMIMDDETPKSLKNKYVSVLRESFDQLEYIIQDIVDFLKIESSQFHLIISKFCLKSLLQEVVESIQKRIEEHEIQIFLISEIGQDYNVSTDRSRLKRVLINVLSFFISVYNNCELEFSTRINSSGGYDFALSMVNPSSGPKCLDLKEHKRPIIKTLSVKPENDFGMVISKIYLAKLKGNGIDNYDFDDYDNERGNVYFFKFSTSSLSADFSPTQKFAVADPKFLRIERNSLTTPLSKKSIDLASKHLDGNKINRDVSGLVRPCPKILIVDDDNFNLLSINLLLEKLNYFSIKANNGAEAITNLTKYQNEHKCLHETCKGIELIIMDLMMPVMNGLECSTALLEMMKKGEIREIPILACTANDSKDIIERCQQIGIKEVLSKPINLDILKKSVAPFL